MEMQSQLRYESCTFYFSPSHTKTVEVLRIDDVVLSSHPHLQCWLVYLQVLRYYISEIERQGKDFSFLPPTDPSAGVPGVVNSSHPSVGALGVVNASSPVVGAPGVANYSNPSTAARWEVKKLHDEAVDRKGARLEKQLENSSRLKYIILLYLSLLGSGFAYVLSVIMCKQYY